MTAMTMSTERSARNRTGEHPDAPFWNRMAARYARTKIGDVAAYETKLAMTRDYLTPESKVLEFGCGTGTTALHHASYAAHIQASDVASNMIEIARDKAVTVGIDNVDFTVAPLESLSVPDASLDMVMAHSILHLVEDRAAAIATAYRWLKPGGTFVSSTACLRDMFPWMRPLAPLARLIGLFPPTLRFFSEAELTAGLTAAGFEIERRFRPKPRAAVFLVARKPSRRIPSVSET